MARMFLIAVLLLMPAQALAQEDDTSTYTTLDGMLTIRYPSNWLVDEASGVVLLTNSERAQTKNTRQLINDEILISFTTFPAEQLVQELDTGTPLEGLNAVLTIFSDSDFDSSFGPTKEIPIGDFDAALVKGIVESETGDPVSVIIIVADLQGENYLFMVGAAAGQRNLMDVTAYNVVKSLVYSGGTSLDYSRILRLSRSGL